MEIINSSNINDMVLDSSNVMGNLSSPFIEANTKQVSIKHLKNDCIVPVFAKDNECTISHYQFISETFNTVKNYFKGYNVSQPQIRVSHQIKGRIPSAIGKPVKELEENEKTIYYERCAFIIEVPEITAKVNNNLLALTIGGVRSLSQENLYSKKNVEKFKIFIGFQNKVCTNLCVSSDGFTNEIRIASISELESSIDELINEYDREKHLQEMGMLHDYELSENQFAHFIGKTRMYHQLSREEKKSLPTMSLSDSQISNLVKDYYACPNFRKEEGNIINLWRLYNLMTEANKSSYIDSNYERNVDCFGLVKHLANSMESNTESWFLN